MKYVVFGVRKPKYATVIVLNGLAGKKPKNDVTKIMEKAQAHYPCLTLHMKLHTLVCFKKKHSEEEHGKDSFLNLPFLPWNKK